VSADLVAGHFARWLTFGSGCSFAASFATGEQKRIAFSTFLGAAQDSVAEYVAGHFSAAAEQEMAAVAIFPAIRSEEQVIEFLRGLRDDDRWRCKKRVRSDASETLLVGLDWRTECGAWSQTIGFAPLLAMPVTRRAPYVAVGAWPGKPRKQGADTVGFIDMPSRLPRDKRNRGLAISKARRDELMGAEAQAVDWHQVTFCFSPDQRARLDWL
jgi:hypothetical protein